MSNHPSTARNENGRYIHDPLNQTLSQAEAEGKLGPHDLGQLRHPVSVQGYCEAHLRLGCEVCSL